MSYKSRRLFTLLEIVVCIAILGLAAVGIGWQMKGMMAIHHFDRNMSHFFAQLRKAQLVALSDRVDIDLHIVNKDGKYECSFYSDDPLLCFIDKSVDLTGVIEIKNGKKKVDKLSLHLHPSGRVGPAEKITFLQTEDRGVILDLTTPLCIELKKL
ncbi:MAG: type II secretion system protein [Verrucomicrobia bacterium]|nr:type II secretion system protein [Verrucomicrobiota bacterium]